jgi:trans-aconitate methyltransferase
LAKLPQIDLPADIDWQHWIERWDGMQDHYILRRKERFELMVWLVADTQENTALVLDIGCGTGSLMQLILERFPEAEVCGIDFDPTLLVLAKKRLARFGERVRIIECDLRDKSWVELVPNPVNAVVSATALHWLSPQQLINLYEQLGKILCPGGIFLNADHVRSNILERRPCSQPLLKYSGRMAETQRPHAR